MSHTKRLRVETSYRIVQKTLVIDLGKEHRVLSSAPRGGGLSRSRYILNHQVEANPSMAPTSLEENGKHRRWCNPTLYLGRVAAAHSILRQWVGLMTAVPMKQLVVLREESRGIWVECFCTVGVTNAVKAGEPPLAHDASTGRHGPGTINIILVTNANLSTSAMVGAVQVVTESKTAVLIDRGVPSWTGRHGATGTGTDAVVIACRLREASKLHYSGTHTEIGAMIGRLVSRCVEAGLVRATRWARRNRE